MLRIATHLARRGAGFTLVEAIVVIVILGVLAGMTMPVVLSIGSRAAEQEAKDVRALLTVAADKANVMHQVVAVDFAEATTGANARGARLTIWVQKEDAKSTGDATGAARVVWQEDLLSDTVELTRLRISQALQDGAVLSGGKWRVTFVPGHPRPSMELRLEPVSSRDGPTWTVTLKPDDTSASLTTGTETKPALGASARTVDLDDTGQGDAKW